MEFYRLSTYYFVSLAKLKHINRFCVIAIAIALKSCIYIYTIINYATAG